MEFSKDLKAKINSFFKRDRDKDFFYRIWDTDLEVYKSRLRAIGFSGLDMVLDAGSGYGQWTVALAEMNEYVTGVENDEERIELASMIVKKLGHRNINFNCAGLEKLGLPDNYFDGAFSYNVVSLTDYRKSLMELHRVIKRNGLLYFNLSGLGWYLYNIIDQHNPSSDFSPRQWAIEALENTLNYYTEGVHETGKSLSIPKKTVLKELEKMGFKIISEGDDGTINTEGVENIVSFFPGTKYNLEAVYEILCKKI
jgi:ubiquinone/menaquinone biosynthesis C-methylase UbiE